MQSGSLADKASNKSTAGPALSSSDHLPHHIVFCVQGDCSGSAATEPYNDYEGAVKCMLAGADVAFVKHTTPLDPAIVPFAQQV